MSGKVGLQCRLKHTYCDHFGRTLHSGGSASVAKVLNGSRFRRAQAIVSGEANQATDGEDGDLDGVVSRSHSSSASDSTELHV